MAQQPVAGGGGGPGLTGGGAWGIGAVVQLGGGNAQMASAAMTSTVCRAITVATLLKNLGVPARDAQLILGH